jgi:protein-S-isoprenylcysteine O-methyltransferase Ste14
MNHIANPYPRLLGYRPPRIAFALLTTAGALQLAVTAALDWPRFPSSPTGGAVLALVGFLIMLRAWWLFRVHQTAICPTAETSVLITNDIYRLTRNPMYLGMVMMLLGIAMGVGGPFFYLAALAFYLIIDLVFCPHEEDKLDRSFGDRFARYRSTVRRWL